MIIKLYCKIPAVAPSQTPVRGNLFFYSKILKRKYYRTGSCLKCGKCCRYMYSFDTYTTTDFKIMQFLFPAYRRFYIRGKDEDGNLIFACKYVTEEGLCSVYDKRLRMCKKYPASKIGYPGKLHKGCGYQVEDKSFESYLKNKK